MEELKTLVQLNIQRKNHMSMELKQAWVRVYTCPCAMLNSPVVLSDESMTTHVRGHVDKEVTAVQGGLVCCLMRVALSCQLDVCSEKIGS